MTYVSRRRWTPDEDREIRSATENFRRAGRRATGKLNFTGAETLEELAQRIGRTPDAVCKRAVRIGARRYRASGDVGRNVGRRRPWTRPRVATPWISGRIQEHGEDCSWIEALDTTFNPFPQSTFGRRLRTR